jgi:hypothetical protein
MKRTTHIRVDPDFYRLVVGVQKNTGLSSADVTRMFANKLRRGWNFTLDDIL